MLKRNIAGILVAGLLSGAAGAADSTFPYSDPEYPVGPSSYAEPGRSATMASGAAESPFPSDGGNEFAAWLSAPTDADRMAERMERTHGSVYPSSSSEVGSHL